MKVNEVIGIYTSAIKDAVANGANSVPVSELQRVNEEIIKIAADSPEDVAAGEAAMERYKAQLAANIEHHRNLNEYNLELLRGTISTGQSAVKSSLLINGGAAVAILAFFGNAWGKGLPHHVLSNAAYGLSLFVWGVLAAAGATGFVYVSQAGFADEFGKNSQRIGIYGRNVAMILVATSYVLFGCGAWATYLSLSG